MILDRMTERYGGTFWRRNFALLERLWEPTWDILPNTTTILPLIGLGDDGQPNATTFITRRGHANGVEATFTWQATDGGPSNWTNGNDLTSPDRWQGIVPIIDFDGVNDEADTPDILYWSVDDSGDNGFSLGVWVNAADSAATRDILAKWGSAVAEWRLNFNGNDSLRIALFDESSGLQARRDTDSAVAQGQWIFIVITYDGTGGTSAADGLTIYVDGVAVASTATNSSYTAMENTTQVVSLAIRETAFFEGKMAGGPLGPWFATHNGASTPTAAQIKRLYNLGRAALGV